MSICCVGNKYIREIEATGVIQSVVLDTEFRSHVSVYVKTITASALVTIHGSPDNAAWDAVRFAQTGAAADPDGFYTYYGFIDNGHRYLRVAHNDNAVGAKIVSINSNP